MPRDIPTPSQQTPIDGVLLSRRALHGAARAQKLTQEARRHAQRILRDAERHAEMVRQHAYQEGYQQGLLSALHQVATYLLASQTMAWSWRERLNEHARAMLSAAVDHPDTLLLLLDEWLRQLEQGNATLHLTLPETSRSHQHRLMELLAEHWSGPIQLDYHSDPRCIMRCADQLAEFSPELYVEPASRQLQQCLDALPQDCRQVSAQALRELIAQWEQQANDTINRNPE
ncbi:hypothetical protein JFK97_11740 [Chromobacterium phragmitis]|uniref:hypothetical protein n=1 Tax=Chromobacterium amazonense TaxID=1382803 RepID=UPI0021B7CDC7|nr:hypothetical protein [Chromobacterium amazonense]MBM2885062.1 hypothetical protein [Chromobacterium amazonense]MDE1715705.1 hypothetical protein [Chromobacterium amazonense]